jgi:hypothetical protein
MNGERVHHPKQKSWEGHAMRAFIFMLATSLLMSTVAVAQSLDITADSTQPGSEPDTTVVDRPDLEDFESQADSPHPVLIEPKFDMTAEPDDLGTSSNLHQIDPDPSPGLVIKVPTN